MYLLLVHLITFDFSITLIHDIVTGGKVETKLSCRFRLLKVRELEFQPSLPTFWVPKGSVKFRHGLQWSASNYFSPGQLKTSPKKPKSRLLNIILPQVGFFDFSAFKSRLWALIKKVRSRFLIYDVKILAFHLILSFG